jgi:hypothetical protein
MKLCFLTRIHDPIKMLTVNRSPTIVNRTTYGWSGLESHNRPVLSFCPGPEPSGFLVSEVIKEVAPLHRIQDLRPVDIVSVVLSVAPFSVPGLRCPTGLPDIESDITLSAAVKAIKLTSQATTSTLPTTRHDWLTTSR